MRRAIPNIVVVNQLYYIHLYTVYIDRIHCIHSVTLLQKTTTTPRLRCSNPHFWWLNVELLLSEIQDPFQQLLLSRLCVAEYYPIDGKNRKILNYPSSFNKVCLLKSSENPWQSLSPAIHGISQGARDVNLLNELSTVMRLAFCAIFTQCLHTLGNLYQYVQLGGIY